MVSRGQSCIWPVIIQLILSHVTVTFRKNERLRKQSPAKQRCYHCCGHSRLQGHPRHCAKPCNSGRSSLNPRFHLNVEYQKLLRRNMPSYVKGLDRQRNSCRLGQPCSICKYDWLSDTAGILSCKISGESASIALGLSSQAIAILTYLARIL